MRTRKQLEDALERAHMDVAHYMAREVARHEQVKALRKMAKELYLAITLDAPWTDRQIVACKKYEKEMK